MKTPTLQIRPYEDEDEARVLELLVASLGGGPAGARPPEFFRWKHLASPFGRTFMLVASAEGRIVGLRAFMRWHFRAGDRALRAVRAVDTATHPDFQGLGIFSKLTREALETLRGEIDFVFNTPNSASLPGYLKMGWRTVGRVPVSVRLANPLRLVRLASRRGTSRPQPEVRAETAAEALADTNDLASLLAEAGESGSRIGTERTPAYLSWRYGQAPLLGYHAVRAMEAGRVRGIAIFRVRPRMSAWESTVSELIVPSGDRRTGLRLLRDVRRAARVDHLACHFPAESTAARAARHAGYLRGPRGITFVANPLRDGIEPDPTDMRSWALSLGDIEVF